jgi:hypothetical protein
MIESASPDSRGWGEIRKFQPEALTKRFRLISEREAAYGLKPYTVTQAHKLQGWLKISLIVSCI